MRRLGAALLLVLAACAPAVSDAAPAGVGAVDAGEPQVFVLDGGLLAPLANGGRVALANGWAELSFSPYPPRTRSDLDVRVFDGASGQPVRADVTLTYEMIAMEHGIVLQRAIARDGGHHRFPLNVAMPGAWRFLVKVVHQGTSSTVLLLIPEVR